MGRLWQADAQITPLLPDNWGNIGCAERRRHYESKVRKVLYNTWATRGLDPKRRDCRLYCASLFHSLSLLRLLVQKLVLGRIYIFLSRRT